MTCDIDGLGDDGGALVYHHFEFDASKLLFPCATAKIPAAGLLNGGCG